MEQDPALSLCRRLLARWTFALARAVEMAVDGGAGNVEEIRDLLELVRAAQAPRRSRRRRRRSRRSSPTRPTAAFDRSRSRAGDRGRAPRSGPPQPVRLRRRCGGDVRDPPPGRHRPAAQSRAARARAARARSRSSSCSRRSTPQRSPGSGTGRCCCSVSPPRCGAPSSSPRRGRAHRLRLLPGRREESGFAPKQNPRLYVTAATCRARAVRFAAGAAASYLTAVIGARSGKPSAPVSGLRPHGPRLLAAIP